MDTETVEESTPDFVFRYRHFQGKHREYTAQILTDSLLYFPSPSTFNDPFDCRVHFNFTATDEEIQRYYMRLLRKIAPAASPAKRLKKARQDMNRFDRTSFLENITRALQEDVNKVGVLSLSAVQDNVLMWSHYAAGHSGICLRFDVSAAIEFFGIAQKVIYASEYPKVELLSASPEDKVKALLMTKANEWSYENEWRIFNHHSGPEKKKFSEPALIGVIFGARISSQDRDFAIECIRARKSPVKLYQATANASSFALDIKPYEP